MISMGPPKESGDSNYKWTQDATTLSEQGGTHLDAPRHFARGQHSADDTELESCF